MSYKWLCSLAGAIVLLAPQALLAQTTGTPSTTTGGTPSGGGSPGGGVSSNSISGNTISGPSFGNLGPSTSMAPNLAIPSNTTTGGRTTTGTGTSTAVPTTYNPWTAYYLNPYQPGLGSSLTGSQTQGRGNTNTGGAFGQPLYAIQTATTTSTSTTGTASTQSQGTGFTTLGMNKAPAYITALAEDFVVARPSAGQLQKVLLATLNRSSALKGQGNIELSVAKDGQVILKGEVSKAQFRRLAEGLVRMTPGVFDVRNELQVTADKK